VKTLYGRRLRKLKLAPAGNVVFIPKKLPCEVVINQTVTGVSYGSEITQHAFYYLRGSLFKYSNMIDEGGYEELLLRPDVSVDDPKSDKIYVANFRCSDDLTPPCSNVMFEEKFAVNSITDSLDWFAGKWEFATVTNSTFVGKPCKMYYKHDDRTRSDFYLFASFDNMVLGAKRIAHRTNETYYVSYSYNATFDNFVISKGTFTDINDTRAYVAPVDFDPCAHVSSSSVAPSGSSTVPPTPHSSFAANTKSALAVVLIAAAATLIFLL